MAGEGRKATFGYASHFTLGACALGLLSAVLFGSIWPVLLILAGIPLLVMTAVGALAIPCSLLGSVVGRRERALLVLGGFLAFHLAVFAALLALELPGALVSVEAAALPLYSVLAVSLAFHRVRSSARGRVLAVAAGLLASVAVRPAAVGIGTRTELLSEHFALRHVDWDPLVGAHRDVLAREPDGSLAYRGSIDVGFWNKPFSGDGTSGLEEVALAVARDGRSVVFRHAAEFETGWVHRESGIWRATVDGHPELLVSEYDLVHGWMRWPKPIPPDLLPYRLAESRDAERVVWAMTAEGQRLPLALVGGTPLHRAAWDGATDEAERLLAGGADVDAPTYWGYTPLHVAIVRGQDETALFLLDAGADPEGSGEHAAFLSANCGRSAVLQALLEAGTPREMRREGGGTLREVAEGADRYDLAGFGVFGRPDLGPHVPEDTIRRMVALLEARPEPR